MGVFNEIIIFAQWFSVTLYANHLCYIVLFDIGTTYFWIKHYGTDIKDRIEFTSNILSIFVLFIKIVCCESFHNFVKATGLAWKKKKKQSYKKHYKHHKNVTHNWGNLLYILRENNFPDKDFNFVKKMFFPSTMYWWSMKI